MEAAPAKDYSHIVRRMSNEFLYAKVLSVMVDQSEFDGLSRVLIQLYNLYDKTLIMIHALIDGEFERNFREPGSILRSNCVASKIMGNYSRMIGTEFLMNILGDTIKDLVSTEEVWEIDPQKLSHLPADKIDEVLEKNRTTLREKTKKVLETITSSESIDIMPKQLRIIAGFIYDKARTYAADRLNALVGGYIMLRLFNPCIVTPEAFGLLAEGVVVSKEARRNLTLISKIIQNLSNDIPFGNKESYMICMNQFLNENRDSMNQYLSEVPKVSLPSSAPLSPTWRDISSAKKEMAQPGELTSKDLAFLHRLLYLFRDKILEAIHQEAQKPDTTLHDQEAELFNDLMNDLGPPSEGNIVLKREVQENIKFLGQVEKAGCLSALKDRPFGIFKPKRPWLVLTENFLHHFDSPQETRPKKSIAITELSFDKRSEKQFGEVLVLHYYNKDHYFSSGSTQELDGWHSTLKEVKRRREEKLAKKADLHSKAYTPGLRLDYKCFLSSIERDENDCFVFVFTIDAFGTKWIIRKHLCKLIALHDQLSKNPNFRFVFPAIPKFEEQVDSNSFADNDDHHSSAHKRMMARKSTVKSQQMSSPPPTPTPLNSASRRGTAATAAALRSPESHSKKILYMGKLENGELSPGVQICCNFWEAFFHEALMKIPVAQSNELLSFLELNDPFRAVSEDNVQLIRFLADTKPESLNNLARDLRTPLHFAVLKESKVLVEHLVKNVKLDLQDSGGNTPLLLSLVKGANPDIIETLINVGANVNAANKAQQTPMHIASEQGYKSIVLLLLEKGAKIDVQDSQQRTPIVRAIQKQFEEVALALIENNASLNWTGSDGYNLLLLASSTGLAEVVRVIIDKGFLNLNCMTTKEKQTSLHLAAKGGYHKTLELFTNKQVDFNATDSDCLTPLMVAVIEGHAQCVEVIAPHCDVNMRSLKSGFTALHYAVQKGNIPIIRLLIEKFFAKESEPDILEGRSPLHIIPRELANRVEVMSVLVKLKADKNLQDKHGCTPLHVAIKNSDEALAKALINSPEIKLNVQDEDGNTPLHLAMFAKNDRKEILSLLLRSDANVEVTNKLEETPLHAAAMVGCDSCFCMLLCKDPDVNCKNRDGNTPLHIAAELGHIGVLMYLHNYGCDLNATNKKGVTPIQLAVAAKQEVATMLLLDLGAQMPSSIKSKVKSIRETTKKRKDTVSAPHEVSKVLCILMKKPENEVIQTIKINRDSFNNINELKNALVLRFASVPESKNLMLCFHSELGDLFPLDEDTPFRRVKIAREIRAFQLC